MATSSRRGLPNRSGTDNNNGNPPWGSSWRLIRRVPSNMISENSNPWWSSSSSSSFRVGPYSLRPRARLPENPSGSTPWGIEVNPGHPYTYPPKEARIGLTITKASVGDGCTGFATHLYCTVGHNGHPFWIGWLPPHKTEVIMDVYQYVKETEDVIFTVFGPQPVYLSGYYMVEEHAELGNDACRPIIHA